MECEEPPPGLLPVVPLPSPMTQAVFFGLRCGSSAWIPPTSVLSEIRGSRAVQECLNNLLLRGVHKLTLRMVFRPPYAEDEDTDVDTLLCRFLGSTTHFAMPMVLDITITRTNRSETSVVLAFAARFVVGCSAERFLKSREEHVAWDTCVRHTCGTHSLGTVGPNPRITSIALLMTAIQRYNLLALGIKCHDAHDYVNIGAPPLAAFCGRTDGMVYVPARCFGWPYAVHCLYRVPLDASDAVDRIGQGCADAEDTYESWKHLPSASRVLPYGKRKWRMAVQYWTLFASPTARCNHMYDALVELLESSAGWSQAHERALKTNGNRRVACAYRRCGRVPPKAVQPRRLATLQALR